MRASILLYAYYCTMFDKLEGQREEKKREWKVREKFHSSYAVTKSMKI